MDDRGFKQDGVVVDEVALFEKKKEDAIADLLAKGTTDLNGVKVNLIKATDQVILAISTPILGRRQPSGSWEKLAG